MTLFLLLYATLAVLALLPEYTMRDQHTGLRRPATAGERAGLALLWPLVLYKLLRHGRWTWGRRS